MSTDEVDHLEEVVMPNWIARPASKIAPKNGKHNVFQSEHLASVGEVVCKHFTMGAILANSSMLGCN
jgi:hypothetical protein